MTTAAQKEYWRQYYIRNREKFRLRGIEYRLKNKDRLSAWHKNHSQKPEVQKRKRDYARNYYRSHPEKREAIKAWQRNNPEKRRISVHKYRSKNREKVREWSRRYNRRIKQEIAVRLGRACKCCGESKIEFLSIDHINGNGKEERAKYKCLTGYYLAVARGRIPTKDLRLLCMNCNHSIGMYGYCPHSVV